MAKKHSQAKQNVNRNSSPSANAKAGAKTPAFQMPIIEVVDISQQISQDEQAEPQVVTPPNLATDNQAVQPVNGESASTATNSEAFEHQTLVPEQPVTSDSWQSPHNNEATVEAPEESTPIVEVVEVVDQGESIEPEDVTSNTEANHSNALETESTAQPESVRKFEATDSKEQERPNPKFLFNRGKAKDSVSATQSTKPANSAGNGVLAQTLLKQITQKEKVGERRDVDVEDIRNQEAKRAAEMQKKGAKSKGEYKVDENFRKEVYDWKNILQRMGLGLLIGVSSAVPTNSTATLLTLTKKYDDVLYNLRNCFRKANARQWGLTMLWVLPLLVVWFGAFMLTYYIIFQISHVGFGPAMLIGFSGFTIFSIPIYILVNKVPMIKNIHELGRDSMERKPKVNLAIGVVGFLLILLLGLVSRFAWQDGSTSAIVHGLSLQSFDYSATETHYGQALYTNVVADDNETQIAFLGLVANFFAGMVVLLPGLSSGILLSTFGRWTELNYAVQVGFGSHYASTQTLIADGYTLSWAWPIIIISALSAIGGFIASLFLLTWIKNKWGSDYLNVFSLGMLFGGLFATYIAISPLDYSQLGHNARVLGCALGLFFGMIIPAGGIFIYLNERNHIQIQKLRMNHFLRKENTTEKRVA